MKTKYRKLQKAYKPNLTACRNSPSENTVHSTGYSKFQQSKVANLP